MFLTIAIGGTYLAILLRPRTEIPRYTCEIIKTYPHQATAFTQGLLMDGGFLWESTGRYGESSVRKVDLETGDVLDRFDLDEDFFGEGLTLHNDKFYQLTWKAGKAFVYDRELNKIDELQYDGQGWGLASNGTDLIFSDGSPVIKFLDPDTFEERRTIFVRRADGYPVGQLNELEYSDYEGGRIYANIYLTDFMYEIDPSNGDVTKIIELNNLWPRNQRPSDGVLNGIAFHEESGEFLVTGKLCPEVFEVDMIPVE